MEAKYYLTCLWPGLAELWWRGRLSALPAAVAFALAVNLFLVARYLYPQWIAGGLVALGFWVGLLAWIFYVLRSVRELPSLIQPRSVSDRPDRFSDAHAAYLQGHWSEAEGLLTDVLAIEPRDPPALLLLTGVYRHTRRLEAASILLREIGRLEIADPWWLEVEAENRRLSRALNQRDRDREDIEKGDPCSDDGSTSGSESVVSESPAGQADADQSEIESFAADLTEKPGMAA